MVPVFIPSSMSFSVSVLIVLIGGHAVAEAWYHSLSIMYMEGGVPPVDITPWTLINLNVRFCFQYVVIYSAVIYPAVMYPAVIYPAVVFSAVIYSAVISS